MKAIVQERLGSPDGLALRDIDKPEIGADQVLVRVRAASLNASDWHLMRRLTHLMAIVLSRRRPSRVRGGDLAGVVEAVGSAVTRLRVGDEVFGVGLGSFAEYAAAPENRLAPKPRNLSFDQAAALAGAGCTALQGLRDQTPVQPGHQVLIYGAGGGVGTFAVQIAKAFGARVTGVTTTENLDLVRSLGADLVVDYTAEDFTARGEQYDVLVDIGSDRSWSELRRLLKPNGKALLVGAPQGTWAMLGRFVKVGRSNAQGPAVAFLARINPEDLGALKDLAEAGKLTPVIDRRYELDQVAEALRYLGTRRARGKIVIRVS